MLGRTHENKKVYRNILISFIVCIVITLLVSSTILYVNFNNIALKQVYRSDSNSLRETSLEVSKIAETATSLSFQIYRDFTITKLLFYEKPDIYDVTFAMGQLNNYRLAMPFIDSIYVYSAKSQQFYVSSDIPFQAGTQTKDGLSDQSMVNILDHFQDYVPFMPIPRTYKLGTALVSSYSFLCYDAINNDHTLNSAVVVNISEAWMNQNIGSLDKNFFNTGFIVDKNGFLLSSHEKDPIMSDYSKSSYMKKIIADASSSGFLVDSVDHVKSLISYTEPDTLGWRYVRVTPYSVITQEIKNMRTNTIYISLGILIFGLLVSIFTSRRVYGPIDKVLHRIRALEIEQRNSLQILRQDFLRGIILGTESYTSKALQDKLSYFGSKMNIHLSSLLVLCKIDHYSECVNKYKEEIKLIRYAMMNICIEIGSPSYNVEAIDMGDEHVLLLLTAHETDHEMNKEVFLEMLQTMQTSIASFLKLTVSMTIGPVKESAEQSITYYKQIMEASFHRLFRGHESIIYSEEIMAFKSKDYTFPVHKEKQLVESLMSGKSVEAEKIYSEIVSETVEYPYSVVQLAISHLMLTINSVINTIKRNNALVIQPDFDSTIVSLNQVEIIKEINIQFISLFDQLKKKLEEKRSMKHEDMIKKMNEIIEKDYGNPNLCLNSIADELNMSPIYISRLYKQHTLIALSDVIQDVRMMKSKELLMQSNLSVADIAEKTGFTSSSYFYRMFKKSNGVTPSDFRKRPINKA